MKKIIAIAAALALLTAALAGCGSKAPESLEFGVEACLLGGEGETFDAGAVLTVNGDGVSQEVVYTSSDEAVVTVSADGIVTAVGSGSAVITAASVEDDAVTAAMDVAVYAYHGTYSGTKFIDAMGCEINVDITLNADGTFSYHRGPLVINMEGGGEMPALEDAGTYVLSGSEITFTADTLGEYTLTFAIADGAASIGGKVPTGGPTTEMVLALAAE